MDELITKDEQASGAEVFLSWCGVLLVLVFGPPPLLWWWLSPVYSRLGPLPEYEQEGMPQRRDSKGDK